MDNQPSGGLVYSGTNENLDAIVMGLDLQPEDSILAVGGSGDQAFALLEKAGSVTVVDTNPAQIELIRKRAELLRLGDYEGFCASVSGNKSPEYFSRSGIEKTLHDKVGRLYVRDAVDVLEVGTNETFTKIYLSNAIFQVTLPGMIDPSTNIGPETRDSLKRMAGCIPIDGLIYSAVEHDDCFLSKQSFIGAVVKVLSGLVLNKLTSKENDGVSQVVMTKDERLTSIARRYLEPHEVWTPTVYRRILR